MYINQLILYDAEYSLSALPNLKVKRDIYSIHSVTYILQNIFDLDEIVLIIIFTLHQARNFSEFDYFKAIFG